ncbi:unnamed protein product [Arctogadus glacialis]
MNSRGEDQHSVGEPIQHVTDTQHSQGQAPIKSTARGFGGRNGGPVTELPFVQVLSRGHSVLVSWGGDTDRSENRKRKTLLQYNQQGVGWGVAEQGGCDLMSSAMGVAPSSGPSLNTTWRWTQGSHWSEPGQSDDSSLRDTAVTSVVMGFVKSKGREPPSLLPPRA